MYDLPTHDQIVYVRNFIHMFENVRNFVRNCPKSIIISSENLCPKIECPKIKRPKINVAMFVNIFFYTCIGKLFTFLCQRSKQSVDHKGND